jgi:two-component system alkaline phosphatase synthesis response regulator PhoP
MKSKVMIVDDDESIVEYINEGLDLDDFDVISTTDALEAIEMAHQEKPDIIVLDLMMPGIDGLSVWKGLNASTITKSIPVIFITGSMTQEMLERVKQTNAVSYVLKPFDIFVLSDRIKKALKGKAV